MVGTVYRHYKGGRYTVIALAHTHEFNGDEDVVYVSLKTGQTFTRPLRKDSRNQDSWDDEILWRDGKYRPRFVAEVGRQGFFAEMFGDA